ncbi:uncharacterized protein LOC135476817 isoform X1 [Liolophura sinensis]|uniref:uncharacterized protein LOC135476817 isoform X1 n=1 Tax=Liolophura sinensis TaxID=3198878 RepID=UPI003158375F
MKSSEYLSTRLDSVMELMEKGLLRSGQGNLTLTIKGVCHRGSVMQDGRIHSREGTFKTPTGWVSKVTGVKVKKQAAYDTVMFKGVPLSKLRTASVPSGVSGEEGTETCKDTPGDYGITSAVSHLCGVSSGNSAVGNKSQEPVRWGKFLVNCKVCLVSDHELALSESFLGSDFWTENFERCHLSEELWDSITKW